VILVGKLLLTALVLVAALVDGYTHSPSQLAFAIVSVLAFLGVAAWGVAPRALNVQRGEAAERTIDRSSPAQA